MSSFTQAYLEALLDKHFSDDTQKQTWYNTPHAGLGNQTPKQLLDKGRDDSLCNFVKNSMKVKNVSNTVINNSSMSSNN